MNRHPLPAITIERSETPDASIIWLHGLGADGHDFEPIVPQLGLGDAGDAIRFIFPYAPTMPVTINGGYIMPAWYDIRHSDLSLAHDRDGIIRSAGEIQMLIDREIMRGIAPQRIILAGFSQGAAMALYIGLRQSQPLGGIIALSGYLLLPEEAAAWQTASHTTPIFMAHGVEDPIVPYALGDQARRTLLAHQYPVTWHSYPMAHQLCQQEIAHIGGWISALIKVPRPPAATPESDHDDSHQPLPPQN